MGAADGIHLVALAAQSDHHVTRDVRVAGDAGQDTLQDLLRFAGIHGATGFVGEGNHAINVRKITPELLGAKTVAHVMGDRGGTIDAGDNSNIISSSYSPARTGVALKKTQLFGRIKIHGP